MRSDAKPPPAARGPGHWDEFALEDAIERIESRLADGYPLSRRAMALLLLQEDEEILALVAAREPEAAAFAAREAAAARDAAAMPLEYVIAMRRQREASHILQGVVAGDAPAGAAAGWAAWLDRVAMRPATGLPLLLLVLYVGLYEIVGRVGAGMLVDLIEGGLFEELLNPWLSALAERAAPWPALASLVAGEYGVVTMGVRYAVGIVTPIVGMFFLVFAVIEDTGYLPRMAMLLDRTFKWLGLSGRAVIPMVLGLGCSTMATMVTRTLPTARERLMATILLTLAIPCSAQLGVLLALLSGRPAALAVWLAVMCAVFLSVGVLGARLLPGDRPSFYMEIPPLRVPQMANVLAKTWTRMVWYLKEVLPLFVAASVVIWLLDISGAFPAALRLLEWPVQTAGLPPEAAKVFLYGFFRRDYGAAGLYDLDKAGSLTGGQLVVACVGLTLFLPCVAQFLINIKERGLAAGVGISAFVLAMAWTVAAALNALLAALGLCL